MKTASPTAAKQRGMAVISALLITTVVAVIAVGMLTRQSVFTRTLEAEQSRVQGSGVLLGGLEVSRQLLWDAHRQDGLTRLDQPWAQAISNRSLNNLGGAFEGHLEDQQGKFNLRNLLDGEHVDTGQLRVFQRLCELLGVNPSLSQRISQRVISAYPRLLNPLAAGQNPAPGGFDSGRSTSPNAANTALPATQPMLRNLNDLRGMDGLSEAVLERLAQHVSILPATTLINGNTASAEVLAAAVPGLSLSRAKALVTERDAGQWFVNRGDFVNRVRLPELNIDRLNVGISSRWFLLRGQARHERRRVSLEALLYRAEDRMPQVIWSRVGV